MLGRSREAVGDRAGPLEAYRAAVRASPNPGGAFHYSGLDFTEEAARRIAAWRRKNPDPLL
jgi:hypothetical protein